MCTHVRAALQQWSNSNVDFLSAELKPQVQISVMHEMLLAISSCMKRFYDKATIGVVMLQALKFCVLLSGKLRDCASNSAK